MRKISEFAAVLAVSVLFATSTFAEERPRYGSDDWRGGDGRHERHDRKDGRNHDRNDGRNHDRNDGRNDDRYDRGGRNLSAQGRISSLHRERGGYRVQLDRGNQWYYVPASAWRGNRNFDLRIGATIRLGGGYYDDRGYIYCSEADYYDDYGYRDRGYNDAYVAGTVRRIDYRRNILELRDERTGRMVTVDAKRANRNRRRGIDVSDLRRGDYVELEGEWLRGNVFQAYRIDGVDSRRW